MHNTLAEFVEAFVLCIGEAEMTYTSTSSVSVISTLCNYDITSVFNRKSLPKMTALYRDNAPKIPLFSKEGVKEGLEEIWQRLKVTCA